MKKHISRIIYPLLVIALSYWALRFLFLPGFYPMHDDTQPTRIFLMASALSSGQFPVRVVSDLGYGYGYPIFNFYAPLPYYVGAAIYLAGANLIDATKVMIAIGVILSGLTMYFLAREFVRDAGGLLAAVLYIYAPYHAVNIYVRGAIGELYAYGFLPLIILGIIWIIRSISNTDKSNRSVAKSIVVCSLGIGAVLTSHNILGMITVYFFGMGIISSFFYLLIRKKPLIIIRYLLLAFILGLGLSSFFVLPAIFEMKYTKVSQLTLAGSDFRLHYVSPGQLWDSGWGFAGSAPGNVDGMSFKIGKIHLLLGLASLMILVYQKKKNRLDSFSKAPVIILLTIFIISIFFALEPSKFLWEKIPGFSFIQYPWRFLNCALLGLVCLDVLIIVPFKKYGLFVALVLISLVIYINAKYFTGQILIDKKADDYSNMQKIRWDISRISDEYLPAGLMIPKGSGIVTRGISQTKEIKVTTLKEESNNKIYQLVISAPVYVLTNIAYFPGWQAELDGQKIEIKEASGRIGLDLPAGDYILKLSLSDTPIRLFGNTLSFFSLILLVYISSFYQGKIYDKKD